MLAVNLKSAVLNKGRSQSRARFNVGQGSYKNVQGRSGHQDGYQPF